MHTHRRRSGSRLAAVALMGLTACAPLFGPGEGESTRFDRPGAPPEFDVLVGQDLELQGRVDEAFGAYLRAHEKDPDSAYLLRKLAEMSARRGRLEAAVEYAQQALALDPHATELRLFVGTLHRFRRDPAAADVVLRGPAGDPLSEDAALLLYNIHLESGHLVEARSVAEWLVDDQPDSLGAVFALAQVHQRSGDAVAAEAVLREALERDVDELAVYHQIAALHRDQQDRVAEIEIYRELLARYPDHRQTLSRLAEALDEQGETDEAVLILERLEREHGDRMASMRLGYYDLRDSRYDSAAERFQRVLEGDPRQHEITYLLGVVHRRQGRNEEAIAVLERIPPGHNRFVDARTQIAGILERSGRYQEALAQVLEAREHQSARPLDLYLASLQAKAGDFDGALAFLQALLGESPDDPEVLYNLGVLYGEAGQPEQALVYMQQVLEHNPDHAGALNYIGYTWAEQGERLDEAERLVERALEVRPDDGFITDSLGWIYYMRARPLIEGGDLSAGRAFLERSIRELQRAAELTGGDPVISEHLGDAYLLMEDKRRALESYEAALELQPRETEQPELRGKTESLRRELEAE
ncbi:MAG: tetratricopeptide repeat protein [Myxococcota bacterium]